MYGIIRIYKCHFKIYFTIKFLDAAELRKVLSKNYIEGLLYAHDKIATRRMSPTSISASHVDPVAHNLSVTDGATYLERSKLYSEHGNNIKVVKIEKTIEPLGATVKVYTYIIENIHISWYFKNGHQDISSLSRLINILIL